MRSRCHGLRHGAYKHYGARGITVCERWKDFRNFLADMGECPAGKSIDRIDVNGNYEPQNCRWATSQEQNNNKRNSRLLEFNGRIQTLTQWANELGVPRDRIDSRLDRGWAVSKALLAPLGGSLNC